MTQQQTPTQAFIADLESKDACIEAISWIRNEVKKNPILSPKDIWRMCPYPEWLMWLLLRKCINPIWPDGPVVLNLLCDVVERYAIRPLKSCVSAKDTFEKLQAFVNMAKQYTLPKSPDNNVPEDAMVCAIREAYCMPYGSADGASFDFTESCDSLEVFMQEHSILAVRHMLGAFRSELLQAAANGNNAIAAAVVSFCCSRSIASSTSSDSSCVDFPLIIKTSRFELAKHIRSSIRCPLSGSRSDDFKRIDLINYHNFK